MLKLPLSGAGGEGITKFAVFASKIECLKTLSFSETTFLSLSTAGMCGPEDSLGRGCPVRCRELRGTPGLHPPDTRSTPTVGTNEAVLRYSPVTPREKSHLQLKTTVIDK